MIVRSFPGRYSNIAQPDEFFSTGEELSQPQEVTLLAKPIPHIALHRLFARTLADLLKWQIGFVRMSRKSGRDTA